MHSIRAIIIEDEPTGLENLRWKLQNNCPEIEIVAECMDGQSAIRAIRRNLPDVIFLDIMLGDMSGFDVLKAIKHPSFETIFTTSYDEYAIEAIKNSALDYLLKPVDIDELMEAVAKARAKLLENARINNRLSQSQQAPAKMGFPISTGKQFIELKEVVYVEAEDNVCKLQLVGDDPGKKKSEYIVKLTKSLGWVEAKLEDYNFCRVHHSYLINLNHMTEYIRQDGGYVVMSNGKAISVSRRKKDDFLQSLSKWNGSSGI